MTDPSLNRQGVIAVLLAPAAVAAVVSGIVFWLGKATIDSHFNRRLERYKQ